MKRFFERRDNGAIEGINERIKVGVTGCGRGTGTSFVAVSLAYFAAQMTERSTAFVQLEGGKVDIYDALGMDKRFTGREFSDFFELVADGKNIKGIRNLDEKINWALEVPPSMKSGREYYAAKELAAIEYMRLVNNIAGDFIVCDFGDGGAKELFMDMDVIICVVDPLPSKLLGAAPHISLIKSLEARGHKVIWLVNKDNPGVNRRELRDFLGFSVRDRALAAGSNIQGTHTQSTDGTRGYTLPILDQRVFYLSQYNCEIPAANAEIRKTTEPIFTEILKRCLGVN